VNWPVFDCCHSQPVGGALGRRHIPLPPSPRAQLPYDATVSPSPPLHSRLFTPRPSATSPGAGDAADRARAAASQAPVMGGGAGVGRQRGPPQEEAMGVMRRAHTSPWGRARPGARGAMARSAGAIHVTGRPGRRRAGRGARAAGGGTARAPPVRAPPADAAGGPAVRRAASCGWHQRGISQGGRVHAVRGAAQAAALRPAPSGRARPARAAPRCARACAASTAAAARAFRSCRPGVRGYWGERLVLRVETGRRGRASTRRPACQ
jgi:hypothetical protein